MNLLLEKFWETKQNLLGMSWSEFLSPNPDFLVLSLSKCLGLQRKILLIGKKVKLHISLSFFGE